MPDIHFPFKVVFCLLCFKHGVHILTDKIWLFFTELQYIGFMHSTAYYEYMNIRRLRYDIQ